MFPAQTDQLLPMKRRHNKPGSEFTAMQRGALSISQPEIKTGDRCSQTSRTTCQIVIHLKNPN